MSPTLMDSIVIINMMELQFTLFICRTSHIWFLLIQRPRRSEPMFESLDLRNWNSVTSESFDSINWHRNRIPRWFIRIHWLSVGGLGHLNTSESSLGFANSTSFANHVCGFLIYIPGARIPVIVMFYVVNQLGKPGHVCRTPNGDEPR